MSRETNAVLNYPTTKEFTINDIKGVNPDVKASNLQYRLREAVKNGKLSKVGKYQGVAGRPLTVFSTSN